MQTCVSTCVHTQIKSTPVPRGPCLSPVHTGSCHGPSPTLPRPCQMRPPRPGTPAPPPPPACTDGTVHPGCKWYGTAPALSWGMVWFGSPRRTAPEEDESDWPAKNQVLPPRAILIGWNHWRPLPLPLAPIGRPALEAPPPFLPPPRSSRGHLSL